MFFIDYFFYRYYKWDIKRHWGHQTALFSGVSFAVFLFLAITMGIWTNLLGLFFRVIPDYTLIFVVPLFYIFYKRYKKKCGQLRHDYKNLKLNKIIPDGCIPLFGFLYIIIGVCTMISMDIFLEKYFERGEWGEYLLSLFR